MGENAIMSGVSVAALVATWQERGVLHVEIKYEFTNHDAQPWAVPCGDVMVPLVATILLCDSNGVPLAPRAPVAMAAAIKCGQFRRLSQGERVVYSTRLGVYRPIPGTDSVDVHFACATYAVTGLHLTVIGEFQPYHELVRRVWCGEGYAPFEEAVGAPLLESPIAFPSVDIRLPDSRKAGTPAFAVRPGKLIGMGGARHPGQPQE